MYMLMCCYLCVGIAFCRAIRIVCLHDVSMIPIGVEGAHQEEEEPNNHHVVQETFLTCELSHITAQFRNCSLAKR
jgi:hypothetical protein